MPEYSPEPRTYELMTILSPDVPEDDIPSSTETIGGYISAASGELEETLTDSPWGRRRLAYPIRHAGRDMRDGFYTVYHFVSEPSRIGDIERELKLNTQVMRYLLTRYEPVPPEELSEEEAEIAAEDEAAAAYAAAQAAGEVATEPAQGETRDASETEVASEEQAEESTEAATAEAEPEAAIANDSPAPATVTNAPVTEEATAADAEPPAEDSAGADEASKAESTPESETEEE